MKKFILLIGIVIFLSLVGGGIYYFWIRSLQPGQNQFIHPACLSDNEMVTYTIDRRKDVSPVDIIIKDRKSGKEIYKFTINSVWPVYYPVQPRKCAVYVIKQFNFDYKRTKPLPGFRVELWQYRYDGQGSPILTFAEENERGEAVIYYSSEFKVDFLETFIVLIKGYLGRIDFATIIKEIETKKDVFSLKHQDIINKYPDLAVGNFSLNEWTKDSRYFWGYLSYGANILGFFRIERDSWKVDILPAPQNTLGGTAFNPEYGYVTYDTGPGWIGIHEIAEQTYDEWRREGKKVDFYVYNLFTKEKTLLATTDDPSWSFNPQWISDTELEYELPTGEKKIYNIK